MSIQRILCVCIGNGDRSPAMAAVLRLFLKCAGREVICESAGINEKATASGWNSPLVVTAAKRIGIDLSGHTKRHISACDLASYDLVVCAGDEIAAYVIQAGANMGKVYNAQITNPWPCHFQEDYDSTFEQILVKMYRVVDRYFS